MPYKARHMAGSQQTSSDQVRQLLGSHEGLIILIGIQDMLPACQGAKVPSAGGQRREAFLSPPLGKP